MKYYYKALILAVLLILLGYSMPILFTPILKIVLPVVLNFFLAACLAFVTYPVARFLIKHKVNSGIAYGATILTLVGVVALIGFLLFPLFAAQITNFINIINGFDSKSINIEFIRQSETLSWLYNQFAHYIDEIITLTLNWISTFTTDIISVSTNILTNAAIVFIIYIYMLVEYQGIRNKIRNILVYGTKRYEFFKTLEHEFGQYVKGSLITMVIFFFEYAIVYSIIGHPDWRTFAVLYALAHIVPYLGGIIVNMLILITAATISTDLLLKCMVAVMILPNLEGYIIMPFVQKRTIKINPLLMFFAIFVFGAAFGILGVVFALPILIFIKVLIKFYGKDFKSYVSNVWNIE